MLYLILVLLTLWVLETNLLPIRLYRPVKVTGKSFVGVKRQTVPNQSLSLREIVKRFIRREPLPVAKEGYFEDRFGDLEKISKADIVVQLERAEELKGQIKAFNDREKAKADKAAASAAAAPPPIVPGVGGTPVNSPPPQGA